MKLEVGPNILLVSRFFKKIKLFLIVVFFFCHKSPQCMQSFHKLTWLIYNMTHIHKVTLCQSIMLTIHLSSPNLSLMESMFNHHKYNKVSCKVTERRVKPWVWSFFENSLIKSLLASCIRVYVESWGATFGTFFLHWSYFKIILGFNIGFTHATCYPKSWIGLCKASFGPPVLIGQANFQNLNTTLLCMII